MVDAKKSDDGDRQHYPQLLRDQFDQRATWTETLTSTRKAMLDVSPPLRTSHSNALHSSSEPHYNMLRCSSFHCPIVDIHSPTIRHGRAAPYISTLTNA